jgi:sugar lactone lactonase YvrE
VVSTIAGLAGSSGSADGTNSNARFNGPYGIAVAGGNLYVADTGNNTIRELTPSGTNWVVSTLAGLAGSSGSTDGTNSYSRFRYPIGIAVAGGNLYVTDEGNNTIRELTLSGTNWVTSTLAGLVGSSGSTDGTNSSARFNEPYGIAVDSGGNFYVADKYCSTIRKLKQVGVNWLVSTIAGLPYNTGGADGSGSAARFNNPTGIAVDGGGNLYVADEGNNTIRRLALAGTNWVVFTAAGLAGSSGSADGLGSAARFNGPYAIAVDGNTNVYVADSGNSIIRGTLPGEQPLTLAVQMVRQTPGNTFVLTWSAVIGHTYQVQFKTNLLQTAWNPLTSVTASNLTGNASIPVGPDPQRFYRIIP